MNEELKKILSKSGYLIKDKNDNLIIKRKKIASLGQFMIFGMLGLIIFSTGSLILVSGLDTGISLTMMGFGFTLFMIPFFKYLTASYRIMEVDAIKKTIAFKAYSTRDYKLSTVDSLELLTNTSDADVHSFSESNQEYSYNFNLLFGGNQKEELFRIVRDEQLPREQTEGIKSYISNIVT